VDEDDTIAVGLGQVLEDAPCFLADAEVVPEERDDERRRVAGSGVFDAL
jgi:hypothetical protein